MPFNCFPPVVTHWPFTARRSCDLVLFDGNAGRLWCHLCSHGSPRPIASAEHINMMGQNRKENPKTQVLLTKAKSKHLAVSSSSLLQRENRHFVIPAALNATDTETCSGLCNHSLFCQQQGSKLTKLQIRLFRKKNDQQTKQSCHHRCNIVLIMSQGESFFHVQKPVF